MSERMRSGIGYTRADDSPAITDSLDLGTSETAHFSWLHTLVDRSQRTDFCSSSRAQTGIKSSFIIDGDPCSREALIDLVGSLGLRPMAFATAREYLEHPRPDAEACLLLDLELPDVHGLEFQKRIAGTGHPPIIFVASHADIRSSVSAMKLGAIDFLSKPLRISDLKIAIQAALAWDRTCRATRAEHAHLQQRLSALTPRECEVLPLVTSGLLNKQAAAELGISEVTYQIHRSKIMHKMRAPSLPDLVRMAEKLRIPVTHSRRSRPSDKDRRSI